MYIITVEFTIKTDHLPAFMLHIMENAKASCESEPNCRQFDVCTDTTAPNRDFLYEVYADRAAFEAQLASAHFKAFDSTVAPWIAAKAARTYTRLDPA